MGDFFSWETVRRDEPAHRAFTLGYCTHLLTDYFWFNTIFPDFVSRVPDKIHSVPFKEKYYHDTDLIDRKLYYRSPWQKPVWELLSEGGKNSNELLNEEEVEKWIGRTMNWFSDESFDPDCPTRFIDDERVNQFIPDTSERICEIFTRLNIP